jgi:hypothetical protein
MSGGHFDYNQHYINYIIEELENIIEKSKLKTKEELSEQNDAEYYKKYPYELYHYNYPDDIIEEFKNGLNYLKLASIYANRIDYLISGDDSEEYFRSRLDEGIKKIKK